MLFSVLSTEHNKITPPKHTMALVVTVFWVYWSKNESNILGTDSIVV